jgi:ribosomal protein S18 acetylase RimI-like enzyme
MTQSISARRGNPPEAPLGPECMTRWSAACPVRPRTMHLELCEQSTEFSRRYGDVSIAFDVRELLTIPQIDIGLDGIHWNCCPIESPYIKDYDALPGNHPRDWPHRWDLTKWALCAAFLQGEHIGGVAIILDPSEIVGPRHDVEEAVLWDIRVRPDQRNRGIGRQLLAFAEHRASLAGKRRVSVETQNNNVAACKLYAGAGFALRSFDRFAYPTLDEVQLIWSKSLTAPARIR